MTNISPVSQVLSLVVAYNKDNAFVSENQIESDLDLDRTVVRRAININLRKGYIAQDGDGYYATTRGYFTLQPSDPSYPCTGR